MIKIKIIFSEPGGFKVINTDFEVFKENEFAQTQIDSSKDVFFHLAPGMVA
jgi:hypothetical protein